MTTLTDSIKAMPTIADEHGDPCVSQATVLALIEAKAEEWRKKTAEYSWYDDCADELAGERPAALSLELAR